MKSIVVALIGMIFFGTSLSEAQLSVVVLPVEAKGNKAVVRLALKNDLTNAVESARATVRLTGGKAFLGTATKWVIGGERNSPNLAPGATNTFFFVITSEKPLPEKDLTASVIFSRIVLEGGKLGIEVV